MTKMTLAEAVERMDRSPETGFDFEAWNRIKSALAEREKAEPVAWMNPRTKRTLCEEEVRFNGTNTSDWIPLYDTPPPPGDSK